MTELVWRAAGTRPMQGILTQPAVPGANVVVLMLTAGYLPRVGPHRIYVKLARALAARGVGSLRFDFPGVSDSKLRANHSERENQALEPGDASGAAISPRGRDVQQAMDEIQREYGVSKFVILGMCLSAQPALEVARQDCRVSGVVLINGEMLPRAKKIAAASTLATRTQWRYYLRKLGSPANWQRLLTGRSHYLSLAQTLWNVVFGKRNLPTSAAPAEVALWHSIAQSLLPTYVMYTEGSPNWDVFHAYHRPALESLVSRGNILIHCFPGIDHTFTPLWSHQKFIDSVTTWLFAAIVSMGAVSTQSVGGSRQGQPEGSSEP